MGSCHQKNKIKKIYLEPFVEHQWHCKEPYQFNKGSSRRYYESILEPRGA